MNQIYYDFLFHLKCGRKNKVYNHDSHNIEVKIWLDGYEENSKYLYMVGFDFEDKERFNQFLLQERDKFYEEEFSMNRLLGLPLPNKEIIEVFLER